MGLDSVELVMEIEEKFDISITEEDTESIFRDNDILVGDLLGLVLVKIHLREVARGDIGLNRSLWLEIQAAIHQATDVPLDEIELKTSLEALFPKDTRRQTWTVLRETSRYRIKELDYPRAVRGIGLCLTATVIVVEQFQLWQLPAKQWLWPLLLILGIFMFLETYAKSLAVLGRFRTKLPSGMTTVKDLCRSVLATDTAALCRDAQIEEPPRWEAERELDERAAGVWRKLSAIIVDILGVDADEVTLETRMIRDLGMD